MTIGQVTNNYLLYSIAFLTGFVSMSFEILGVRVMSPYYGNSIHVWGAIISVFLGGLGIGYAIGGKIADNKSGRLRLARMLFMPMLLIASFPLYGYYFCDIVYRFNLDSRVGALFLALMLFLLPCIFCGAVLPIIIKMMAHDAVFGTTVGYVFAVSTSGSIAGTLFTAFFLISATTVSNAIVILGGVMLLCWLAVIVPRWVVFWGKKAN
jgi:predicted membrane-bound spermidine synthase